MRRFLSVTVASLVALVMMVSAAAAEQTDEVDFIVRVAPEWRIEFFSCIGNG